MVAYKPRIYWLESWHRFEFFVAVVPMGGLVAHLVGAPDLLAHPLTWGPSLLRIVRLMKDARKLRELVMTMVLSLPSCALRRPEPSRSHPHPKHAGPYPKPETPMAAPPPEPGVRRRGPTCPGPAMSPTTDPDVAMTPPP